MQEEFRIVVSGLVKHYSLEEMQNRKVVVVANLKAANMRGIKSHAMVLAATGADGKVRISQWIESMNRICEYHLWISSVSIICEYHLWIEAIDRNRE